MISGFHPIFYDFRVLSDVIPFCNFSAAMFLVNLVHHPYYINVLCVSTMYVGCVTGSMLHTLVMSTSSAWDEGTLLLVLVVSGSYS